MTGFGQTEWFPQLLSLLAGQHLPQLPTSCSCLRLNPPLNLKRRKELEGRDEGRRRKRTKTEGGRKGRRGPSEV